MPKPEPHKKTDPPEISLVPDGNYYPTAQKIIHNAKKEILLSSFKFQILPKKEAQKINFLVSELISVSTLIPTTKVLLNMESPQKGTAKNNIPSAHQLMKTGIDVRYLADGRTMHAKILIVDATHLLVGSHNWTISSMIRNYEFSVLISNHPIIQEARALFLAVFETARKF